MIFACFSRRSAQRDAALMNESNIGSRPVAAMDGAVPSALGATADAGPFAIPRTGKRRGYTLMRKPEVDIAALTADGRLGLLEQAVGQLASTPETIPLTEAQREELDRRLDDLDAEGPVGIPWDEVLSRIRNRGR